VIKIIGGAAEPFRSGFAEVQKALMKVEKNL